MTILSLPIIASAATAQTTATCVKPPMPACIDDQTTFVSADKMIDCQNAVKDYTETTMVYLACRPQGDVPTNVELMNAVNRFNCRLQGRDNCS